MKDHFTVDGNTLTVHVASPPRKPVKGHPGVVIAHEFPNEPKGGINSTATMPFLADRVAAETGFSALVFAARGMDGCEGDFALGGWRRDLASAVDLLAERTNSDNIWIIGFGTGGALAISVASDDERVRGVAAVAAPADFDDWARNPRKLLLWSREVGVVRDPEFPTSLDAWASQFHTLKAAKAASRLGDRALLVLHGSEDETVPLLDARVIASAHTPAELHIINGAGHHLRHDPRAVAILLGWLERERNRIHVQGEEPATRQDAPDAPEQTDKED